MRMRTVALVGALMLGSVSSSSAQRPQQQRRMRADDATPTMGARGMRGPRAMGLDTRVGQLMDRRYALGLDDEQMSQLGALRQDAHSQLAPLREEMQALREGIRDGTVTASDARERGQALRERVQAADTPLRERLENLLTPEQRVQLRGRALRAGAANRPGMSAGRRGGLRGAPGMRRRPGGQGGPAGQGGPPMGPRRGGGSRNPGFQGSAGGFPPR